jgi:hypothetical protein
LPKNPSGIAKFSHSFIQQIFVENLLGFPGERERERERVAVFIIPLPGSPIYLHGRQAGRVIICPCN